MWVWFEDAKRDKVAAYLGSGEAKVFLSSARSDCESDRWVRVSVGPELLATIDWLVQKGGIAANRDAIKTALKTWTGGEKSAERKLKLFEDRLVDLALERLASFN